MFLRFVPARPYTAAIAVRLLLSPENCAMSLLSLRCPAKRALSKLWCVQCMRSRASWHESHTAYAAADVADKGTGRSGFASRAVSIDVSKLQLSSRNVSHSTERTDGAEGAWAGWLVHVSISHPMPHIGALMQRSNCIPGRRCRGVRGSSQVQARRALAINYVRPNYRATRTRPYWLPSICRDVASRCG